LGVFRAYGACRKNRRADAGYCSEDNLLMEGPELLIATVKDSKQRRAASEARR
jgi:hypothetical protein